MDPAVAVATLQSAGMDVEALKQAIAGAMFLMEIPGDNRQKLRGPLTRTLSAHGLTIIQFTCSLDT